MRKPSDRARQRRHPILWLLPETLHVRRLAAPQFAGMLREDSYAISDSAVYRLLQHDPLRYDRDLLAALCRTLDCKIGDLIEYDPLADDADILPPPFRIPGT